MDKIQRTEFLKRISMLTMAAAIWPSSLIGKNTSAVATPPALPKIPVPIQGPDPYTTIDTSFAIIDMHTHPSLKLWLWDLSWWPLKIWKKHHPAPGTNMTMMQVDTHRIEVGFVKGFLTTHYLPEVGLEQKSKLLHFFFPALNTLFGFKAKWENNDNTNIDQMIDMMTEFEHQVDQANKINSDNPQYKRLQIVYNFADFKKELLAGNIPMAHAIEGAHALGRQVPRATKLKKQSAKSVPFKMYRQDQTDAPTKASGYIANLERLHAQGLCLMTLVHFFPNDLVTTPTEGISADEEANILLDYVPDKDEPLTDIGVELVKKMLELGIIVDLTHSSRAVRMQVLDLNQEFNKKRGIDKQRPVVLTHVGAQALFNDANGRYARYKLYSATDDEIMRISQCGGLIGVLAENFWLTGCDTHTHVADCNCKKAAYGIENMVRTVKYINSQTKDKNYDNVAIGSDLDGLADAPKDLYTPSQFGALITALRTYTADGLPALTEEQVKKVTNLNALRVLEKGWDGVTKPAN